MLGMLLMAGCGPSQETKTDSPSSGAASVQTQGSGRFPLAAGQYTVLGILTDNQDNSKAKENAEAALVTHPDVACFVGLWNINTPMILAALRSSDATGKVKVVGFDEHQETLAGIREGTVVGTIVQQPYDFGYRSVQWLTSLAKGKPVDVPDSGSIYIPHDTITAENVQEFSDRINAIKAGNGPQLSPESDLDGNGVHVAFISNSIDPFWTLAEFGCNKAAAQFGCKVDVQMPSTGSIEEQKRYLETNAANKLDGVAISPIDPANQVGMINEACDAMTVICQDSDAPTSKRKFYLGTSNYMAGRAAAKLIKQAVPDGGKVMLFVGKMEVLNAQERSQGIIDELSDKPVPGIFLQ
ncbi:D-allose transporter subunit [Novipirellula galeiformis]|uniref:D-allose transporter subunit n=2 Tax=Novipirellula galeiformis TaxID=2528004 RepID=A0A5C6CTR0_9BACT|nr:D-allose transporter subunit [Novipirellula galeiformis]